MDIPAINQNNYGSSFCLASCYLAIAQYFGNDVTMQDLIDEGAVGSGGYVNNTGGYFNIGSYKTYSATKVKNAIDAGNPVIISGNSSRSKHYVVAYDYSGSTIYVMDPTGGVYGALGNTTLSSWNKYAICTA